MMMVVAALFARVVVVMCRCLLPCSRLKKIMIAVITAEDNILIHLHNKRLETTSLGLPLIACFCFYYSSGTGSLRHRKLMRMARVRVALTSYK